MSPENSYTPSTALDGEDLKSPGNIEAVASPSTITAPSREDIVDKTNKLFGGKVEQTTEDEVPATTPEAAKSTEPLTNFFGNSDLEGQLNNVADLAKEQPKPAEVKVEVKNDDAVENTAADKSDDAAETDHPPQKDTVANIPEIVLPDVAVPEEHAEVADKTAADSSKAIETPAPTAESEPAAEKSTSKEEAESTETAPIAAEPEIVIVDDEKSAEPLSAAKENQEKPDQSAENSADVQTNKTTTEQESTSETINDLENAPRLSGDKQLLDLATFFGEQGNDGRVGDTLRALHQNIETQAYYGQAAA